MKRFLPVILLALVTAATLSAIPASRAAAADHIVGLRTVGYTDVEKGLRLDINVWYPSNRGSRRLVFPPWKLDGAYEGRPLDGPFPLLLLSHATAGNRFTYHNTAYALAAAGFVVAAPTHSRDNMDNMPDFCSWRQFETRVRELSAVIDVLQADDHLGGVIDFGRIGVIGFGAGGTTALLIGGALPDCSGLDIFCEGTDTGIYCSEWAKPRISRRLCTSLPLTKSPADTRVRAVAAVDPDFAMLFTRDSLRWFHPPLLLVAAGKERTNPVAMIRGLGQRFRTAPRRVELSRADAGTLMAECPEELAEELPELCRTCSSEERRAVSAALVAELSDFFLERLVRHAPAVIPAPPDLAPRVAEEPLKKGSDKARKGKPARSGRGRGNQPRQ